MNQKGFASIGLIIVAVIVAFGIGGYFVLRSNDTVKLPSESDAVVANDVEEATAESNTPSAAQVSPTPGVRIAGGAGGVNGLPQFPDGSVTLLSPNGGETYRAGDQVTVKWRTQNVGPGNTVWIHLDTADGRHLNDGDLVSSHIPNNGEKAVVLPVNIPSGQYKFVITIGQELEDVSDNYISITSDVPTITQEQALALVLKTWGGCTPDSCSSVTVTAHSNYVTAIYEGLRDDSASAHKKVALASYSNGVWTLGELIESSYSCQPGRGHQKFSPEPCL